MIAQGTTPAGARGDEQAARWVRGMFGRIAPRYDLLNHLLSMNIDRYWRARTAREVVGILNNADASVLDICCGTGDLTRAFEKRGPARVYSSDFCHPMLTVARDKLPSGRIFEADALRIPVADGRFDLIAVAFGFRNLANYRAGLVELRRALKPGGTLAILEFSQPPNRMLRSFYNLYSESVLPVIGGIISGSRDAYTYLPESVQKFPGAEQLAEQMRNAEFSDVRFLRMTAGVVALHLGVRSQ